MKTLVLLHGWGARGDIWSRQVAAFGDRLTVLTPTIPRWEVDWFSQFLRTLPLPDTLLVGWSLGGMLLLDALSRWDGPAPGGLALAGVAAAFCRRPDYPWGQPPAAVRAMRRALSNGYQTVLDEFAGQCLAPGEAAFREEARRAFAAPVHPENLGPGLDYLLRQDLRSRLATLPKGAMVMQGAEDRIVPAGQGKFLQEHLPGAKFCLLPGAGHLPFLTQTAAFNEIVQEVLLGGGPGT